MTNPIRPKKGLNPSVRNTMLHALRDGAALR